MWLSLSAYWAYAWAQRDAEPLYVFCEHFPARLLRNGDYTVPQTFLQDYMSLLGEQRPPYKWLVMGRNPSLLPRLPPPSP